MKRLAREGKEGALTELFYGTRFDSATERVRIEPLQEAEMDFDVPPGPG